MPRYAIIEAGKVVNVIIADAEVAASRGLVPADGAAIGDTWDGQQFTRPGPVPVVPASVTMRQARLALLGAGMLPSVEAAIDALSEPQRSAARIEWDYSNEVQRHNGFVSALAPALNLTEQQLDELFVLASTL